MSSLAVCAAQPEAVQAGLAILRAGGSAVDAAIATNACLAVTEPTSCGLGGDLFAIVWDPRTRALAGLNASGRAPAALTIDRVPPAADGTIPLHSTWSWTVPGCVDGWRRLHERYGRLPWVAPFDRAIALARDGFAVTPVIASEWAMNAARFRDHPGFADVFMPPAPDGARRAPRAGETFRNPALAATLERIAHEGADAFYRGPIAEAIVAYSGWHGGCFAPDDFARHTSTDDTPISTDYRGVTVWELPPNGQGLAALQMLNMLEGFDVASLDRGSADYWHLMIEVKKLAYADRARYYADPAFSAVPVEALLSKEYARDRAARFDPEHAAQDDPHGDPVALSRRETTYLCAADAQGMMVSLIQSNYTGMGSGYVIPELGFGIQNRGALFSLDPSHPNALAPGKRPFHTIIPAFLTRGGEPWIAFGLMGGDMQAQGHAQIVVDLVDFGMSIREAGDAARFHHGGSSEPTGARMMAGGVVHLEDAIPGEAVDGLRRRGHRIEPAAPGVFGGYQAIARDPTGVYTGATEKRKDGVVGRE